MNAMEKAALEHAKAELRYQASNQATVDLMAGKIARAKADRKTGHSPACSLTNCAPDCNR